MKKQNNMFNFLILLFLIGKGLILYGQVPIKPGVFGQNAWWINMSNPGNSGINWTEIAASGVTIVRIGGIEPNYFPMYNWYIPSLNIRPITDNTNEVQRLITLIDAIRGAGMDVIVQVGYNPQDVCPNTPPLGGLTMQQQATIAGNLVAYLNGTVYANHLKGPILNWSIANEPDLYLQCGPNSSDYKGFAYNQQTDAARVSAYIKEFSKAMKNAHPANTGELKIFGPELATFGTDANYSVNIVLNELINNPSNTNSIMGTINTWK